MTDHVDNLILEQLRATRNDLATMRGELNESLNDVKARLTGLEGVVAGSRRDNVLQQEDIYRQQSTIDRITQRLERLERRLELHDGP